MTHLRWWGEYWSIVIRRTKCAKFWASLYISSFCLSFYDSKDQTKYYPPRPMPRTKITGAWDINFSVTHVLWRHGREIVEFGRLPKYFSVACFKTESSAWKERRRRVNLFVFWIQVLGYINGTVVTRVLYKLCKYQLNVFTYRCRIWWLHLHRDNSYGSPILCVDILLA